MMRRPGKEMQSISVMIELHRKSFNRAICPYEEQQLKKRDWLFIKSNFLALMKTPIYSSSTCVSGVERYPSDQISLFSGGADTSPFYDYGPNIFILHSESSFFHLKRLSFFKQIDPKCLWTLDLPLSSRFILFWEKCNIKYLWGNATLFLFLQRIGISFHGFTLDSRAWIVPSNSLILSSFFWDSAWASCRALNSSSNCKKRETSMSMGT